MASGIIRLSGLKLLWTNPSPSSPFPAQDITVPTGQFDAFVVECRNAKTSTNYTSFVIVKGNSEVCYGFNLPSGSISSVTFRQMMASDNMIVVQDCQYKDFDATTRTTNNDYLIPNRIFGVPK